MLEDRSYMRDTPFRMRHSATVILLIALAAAFILQLLVGQFSHFRVLRYLALSLDGLRQGYFWQLLTFQFLHGGWLHLILNCWVIYVFGRELEETLGVARFLVLYFGSGFFGGIVQMLAGLAVPHFAEGVLGASAGAFGLVAAFATLYPERPLTLLLFFILPISLRAKFLLLFSVIISIVGILVHTDDIAHAAHLGGLAAGVFFIRYAAQWEWKWPSRQRTPVSRAKVRILPPVKSGRTGFAGPKTDLPSDEFLAQEVDPILDKISAQGIQSLTERERHVLQAARERMRK